MATQRPALQAFNRANEYHIGVKHVGNVVAVTRDPFWVSKSKNEVAEWFCLKDHQHSANPPCFKIIFDPDKKKHPFETNEFDSDANGYASSGQVRRVIRGDTKKKYKYTVVVGNDTLDPQGGVRA